MAARQAIEQAAARYGPSVDRVAARYGISGAALLLKLVKGESNFSGKAVSNKGARGFGQFMPGTRQAVLQKYGIDPWRSADEAVHAAALHLRGKLGHRKGLEGYNPGDPSYPGYILSQRVGGGHATGRRGGGGDARTPLEYVPGESRAQERKIAVLSYLRARQGKGAGSLAAAGVDPTPYYGSRGTLRLAQTLHTLQDGPGTIEGGRRKEPSGGRLGSSNATITEIGRLAQEMGLRVGENPKFGGVGGGHVKGSWHYSGRAIDVSGDARKMARFNRLVARQYGRHLKELFFDPGVNIDEGRRTKPIGGHGGHVHVAI